MVIAMKITIVVVVMIVVVVVVVVVAIVEIMPKLVHRATTHEVPLEGSAPNAAFQAMRRVCGGLVWQSWS